MSNILNPVIIAALIQALVVIIIGFWLEFYRHRKEKRMRTEKLQFDVLKSFSSQCKKFENLIFDNLNADFIYRKYQSGKFGEPKNKTVLKNHKKLLALSREKNSTANSMWAISYNTFCAFKDKKLAADIEAYVKYGMQDAPDFITMDEKDFLKYDKKYFKQIRLDFLFKLQKQSFSILRRITSEIAGLSKKDQVTTFSKNSHPAQPNSK